MFDITDSHKDALNLQTQLNHDMAEVLLLQYGDPGFPKGAPTQGVRSPIICHNVCRKLHENEKKMD